MTPDRDNGDTLERFLDHDEVVPEITTTRTMPKLEGVEIPIKSRSSARVWPVYPEVPYCMCPAFEYQGDCYHVQKAKNMLLIKHSEYFLTRFERELKAKFHSFEAFYDWAWAGQGDPETVYLGKLFIALLFCQKTKSGTTDLIHYAVNEQFDGDPRKVGAVTRWLEKAGYIRWLGSQVPSTRRINHNSMKKVYKLTLAGESIVTWTV